MELLVQRVKQNGKDIQKYFVLEEGQIIVKADLQNEEGDYVVIYDLEGAEALTGSAFRVPFLLYKNYENEDELEPVIEDALVWRPGPGSSGLLLAMDDDYMETWEQYFDLFDKYGARLTFFIQGAYDPLIIGPFSTKALNRGHDVGFHSLNHLDLRRVSMEVFTAETIEAADAFRQSGVPLSSFAYPYGFSEPWMHEILWESFWVLRGYGTTFRIYTQEQVRAGYIISRAIDNTVISGDENFDRLIRVMLRTVTFLDDDRILPLTTHDISDAHWAISQRRLEFLLKTTTDLGLRFYRYSDFAPSR
jgi:peptidoglycan/xylan/chitin deacetylase (PgdA/CDA1 family)